jgi:nucleotide-binding universal stress UspA family protein
MYSHILIATDGSALAAKAVDAGLSLAAQIGAQVTALTVTEPFHTLSFVPSQITDTPKTYEQHAAELAHRILGELQAQAKTRGVVCDTAWVQHEHPYEAIIEGAKSRACDLIVMASHGRRGVSAIVLGSQTLKVLTHSTLPVLVYR